MANERVRMLWPDHLGLARGKYLPVAFAHEGTGHAAAVFSLAYDRSFVAAPGSGVLDGFPDMHATFDPADLRPGWEDDRTKVAVCDLSQGGEPFRYSARYALRKAIADWEALGYRPMVGIEFEAYVLELTDEDGWQRWDTPGSYVYGTGRFVDPVGLIDEIVDLAAGSDIVLESVNAEFDSGQFELTLRYSDGLRAADDAFLFKVLARECALNHGLRLTLLGKPYEQFEGNGVHVNFSLVDANGANALVDTSTDDGLSELAKSCLAGLCAHHQGLTALCAPTVNAYRRLRPFTFSGRRANWGYDHRVVGTRVPPERAERTRIESRLADGTCNIHTAISAVLQAARLGVVDDIECPEPETNDGMDAWNTEVTSALNLADALADLRADTALAEAVSSDLVDNFLAIKDAEWDRYVVAVGEPSDEISEWEISEYLPFH
ncbi:glutamine synthetase family protein [Candidatus Poriferisodalis sp.]|uniref:glutamine synthetase family protein n=1 Tax=Candidatus Poriferisodalis sp. TaxID=3101277 RepID=UPI003D10D092